MTAKTRYGPLFSLSLLAYFGLGFGVRSLQDAELPEEWMTRRSERVRIETAPYESAFATPEHGDLLLVRADADAGSGSARESVQLLTGFGADSIGGRTVSYGFGFEFRDLDWRPARGATAPAFDVLARYDGCTGERAVEIVATDSRVRLDGDALVYDLAVIIHEREPRSERWVGRVGRMDDALSNFVGAEPVEPDAEQRERSGGPIEPEGGSDR